MKTIVKQTSEAELITILGIGTSSATLTKIEIQNAVGEVLYVLITNNDGSELLIRDKYQVIYEKRQNVKCKIQKI